MNFPELLQQIANWNYNSVLEVSNGHSPQIRHFGELLVRMCRGESHFSQKSPLANVGECIESRQSRVANVDECIESGQSRVANVGECMESDQNRLANVGACKIGRFMFICIKRSSLHSLNLPNSPNSLNSLNSCKSRQTCLSRVWRVRAKWFGECRRMYRVRPKQVGECRRMYRVRPIFQNDHFGEYWNSPKMANFRRVLEFDKFAGEWPLLT